MVIDVENGPCKPSSNSVFHIAVIARDWYKSKNVLASAMGKWLSRLGTLTLVWQLV